MSRQGRSLLLRWRTTGAWHCGLVDHWQTLLERTHRSFQIGGRVNRNGECNDRGGAIVFDFILDPVNGITRHPGARDPGEVLKRQFTRGDFGSKSPADLVSTAMIEELKAGLAKDQLSKAEKQKDYPGVAKSGRVILANTRIVVVDNNLSDRLRVGEKPSFQEILLGSVQVWAQKIEAGPWSSSRKTGVVRMAVRVRRFFGVHGGRTQDAHLP